MKYTDEKEKICIYCSTFLRPFKLKMGVQYSVGASWCFLQCCPKGQIKPKADWRAVNLFCLLFCFLRQTKQIHSFVFLGESTASPTCFWFYLTFNSPFSPIPMVPSKYWLHSVSVYKKQSTLVSLISIQQGKKVQKYINIQEHFSNKQMSQIRHTSWKKDLKEEINEE